MYLAELRYPVSSLRGIGAAKAHDLAKLGVRTVGELLLHLPRGYENRKEQVSLAQAQPDRPVNTVATVVAQSYFGHGPKRTLKVHIRDESGIGCLVCFGRNFLAKTLTEGRTIRVYGTFLARYGELQTSAFEFEPIERESASFGRILAIYPLAGSLSQNDVRKAVAAALQGYGSKLSCELPTALLERRGLLPTAQALASAHEPQSMREAASASRSLIYLELFYLQLGIGLRSAERAKHQRPSVKLPRTLLTQLRDSLPFSLTDGQAEALTEIVSNLEGPTPMARLLQGDVGAGKTAVALLSALPIIESGKQVALMAPTELLARQHADGIARLFEEYGIDVSVALLSGSVKAAVRKPLLEAIGRGSVDLVVGTHAVFTEAVEFRNLQYVIIDEQHRFGVMQRAALLEKARLPDVLYMTATPIPRTLALTVFGDLEVSSITTLPIGRKPIETHLARIENEEKVFAFVRRELQAGRQAYFVYPVIDDTGTLNLRDAESMSKRLQSEIFPEFRVGIVHSRVGVEEKQATMEEFRRGELDVLVATSVIEVGVDVPNATVMVIEHAERFGLAALHQLRGRVGRGADQSYCFLVYDDGLTDTAKERLKALHTSTDGFFIAEEDLRIRGPGDIAGIQQAGYLRFRVADLGRDMQIMNDAREDAFDLLESDPGLNRREHASLRAALDAAREAGTTTPFAYQNEEEVTAS
ncbi:MAG: ATP-dependent DNA helicase RecG [Spirochaetota bacterium]